MSKLMNNRNLYAKMVNSHILKSDEEYDTMVMTKDVKSSKDRMNLGFYFSENKFFLWALIKG